MKIKLKDERLGKRWLTLVRSQMQVASPLAAGVKALPNATQAFAATQAAWRFFNNERVELSELIVPLRDYAREQIIQSDAPFVLVAHDWSKLSFPGHDFREDMAELSSKHDIGYELTTSLAVNADNGTPLAPVEMHLKTGRAFLSTRNPAPLPVMHTDQILPTMQASLLWNLGRPIVHVIDREADSVGHYRDWDAAGHKVLIRADDRQVLWDGQRAKLSDIRNEVCRQNAFQDAGPALYHGRRASLQVAEAAVILYRPARKSIRKKRVEVRGRPLPMRLIMTRVLDEDGKVLAQWYLLSNVPVEWANAAKLAHCYYWRWRIESYFKLLKSHGFQIEDWLQETGEAIARRLLVVSMAAVTVWHLMADDSPGAIEFKQILVRLSGRQMKRSRPVTAPALLTGLWSLLAMLDTLEQIDVGALKNLMAKVKLPVPIISTA